MVIYASIDEHKRAQQLGVLMDHIASHPEPCLLMGDFNDLLSESKKEGGNMRTVASM